jgi:hypothetical protein
MPRRTSRAVPWKIAAMSGFARKSLHGNSTQTASSRGCIKANGSVATAQAIALRQERGGSHSRIFHRLFRSYPNHVALGGSNHPCAIESGKGSRPFASPARRSNESQLQGAVVPRNLIAISLERPRERIGQPGERDAWILPPDNVVLENQIRILGETRHAADPVAGLGQR